LFRDWRIFIAECRRVWDAAIDCGRASEEAPPHSRCRRGRGRGRGGGRGFLKVVEKVKFVLAAWVLQNEIELLCLAPAVVFAVYVERVDV